jgi:hypothetical protein
MLRDTSRTGTAPLDNNLSTPRRTLQGLAHPLDKFQNTCYTVFMKFGNLKKSKNPKNSKSQKTGF